MNGAGPSTPFDRTPAEALAAISSHDGLLLVDLDETLYLRNSSEDFIDSAMPGLLAMLLMKLLDLAQPWRWTGGPSTRDSWRVQTICILLPWTFLGWRRHARQRAASFANRPLVAALRQHRTPPVIVTIGFAPIVAPLAAALGFADAKIVASRLFSFEDRRGGKLRLVTHALGGDALQAAMAITDSSDDLALLAACAKPLRVTWPDARYLTALSRVYWPTEYVARIKRPGERYFLRGVLQDDFAYWLLTTVALAAHPVFHAAGLLLLLISFWSIYELGYVDNDHSAEKFEHDPKLSPEFRRNPVATPMVQPWLWAAAFGTAAIFALRYPGKPVLTDLSLWCILLVATYMWFRLYNRIDKNSRVWVFPFLQLARSCAFVVLVPISAVGAAALSAHLFSRWVPYFIYRFGDRTWPETQPHLIRLVFFVLIAFLLGIALGPSSVLNYTGLALLVWSVFRARREIWSASRSVTGLDRDSPREPT